MKISSTGFEGLVIIEPDIKKDIRGHFLEVYNKRDLKAAGVLFDCVQENQSLSIRNVIRGLHFQSPPHAQTKLIRVLVGKILDVVVDLRKGQSTYKQVFALELSAEDARQLYIPKGFAHGFSVLSETAEINYACDEFYDAESQAGILHDDPTLAIDWKVNPKDKIVSEKDLALPLMAAATYQF